MTMNKLKTTTDLVKTILESNKIARNSDMALYIKVVEQLNPSALGKPFWVVLASLDEYGLPSIETVGRCRRKLQAEHPELRASAVVKGFRMVEEEKFRAYAKGVL